MVMEMASQEQLPMLQRYNTSTMPTTYPPNKSNYAGHFAIGAHIRLGVACNKRFVVFKVLMKNEDNSCLRKQTKSVELAITIAFLQQSSPPSFML
jgi:hypothetical protein